MSSIPRYGDEVRILIFDDPSEQERKQSPKFCFAQLYSTRVYTCDTAVDLNFKDAFAIGYLKFFKISK